MKNTSKTSVSAEQTQERLIQEGIRLFALHGISGLRTRQLAEDAGVNQSAIPYHFGGKLGVYTAVIHHIATELATEIHFDQFDVKFQALSKVQNDNNQEIAALIPMLVSGLCRALLAPQRHYYSQLILREQLEPTENYTLIYQNLIAPFHERLSNIIAVLNEKTDKLTATIRAHAIIGQILGFVIARKAFLLRIDEVEMSENVLQEIVQEVGLLSVNALLATSSQL